MEIFRAGTLKLNSCDAKLDSVMAAATQGVKIALVGAAGLILAAILGAILQPSWWRSDSPTAAKTLSIAGTVVEQRTNRGIGQANISIVGRPEVYVTEDNGNFHIELQSALPKDGVLRIHVVKDGYAPYDGTTTQTETLIVQLRRQ